MIRVKKSLDVGGKALNLAYIERDTGSVQITQVDPGVGGGEVRLNASDA